MGRRKLKRTNYKDLADGKIKPTAKLDTHEKSSEKIDEGMIQSQDKSQIQEREELLQSLAKEQLLQIQLKQANIQALRNNLQHFPSTSANSEANTSVHHQLPFTTTSPVSVNNLPTATSLTADKEMPPSTL